MARLTTAKGRPGSTKGKSPPVKHARFTISAALFEELGERLVSKPEIALAELIKNAYDADSPDCTISLADDQIVVADTGHGMTEDEFLKNWMVVSSQRKGIQRFSRRYGRNMAGSKGVGRFSARFLGSVVILTSVAQTSGAVRTRLTATFDWNAISRNSSIDSVSIDYTVEVVDGTESTGTTLRISELREEATAISAWKVKTDILRLTDPAAGLEPPPFAWKAELGRAVERDPGFVVTFADTDTEGDVEVTENVAAEILKAYVGRVRIKINERGRLTYKVFWDRGLEPIASGDFQISEVANAYSAAELRPAPGQKVDERGLPFDLVDVAHLPLSSHLHSPVFIDLRFFPKRQGTFANLPVNGKRAQGWLSQNASVAVVDNNFAMPAYVDRDSDWLGIYASKARNERDWQSVFTPAFFPMSAAAKNDPARNPMLALPRGSQVIGRVHIATRKRPPGGDSDDWLQPNMDRESLRANGAFRLLWHVSRFAVELLAHFDRSIRLKEEERAQRARQKETKTALSAAIAEVKVSKDIEPQFRRRLVTQLLDAQERISEASEYEEEARVSLELMSLMGVMAGFMTHEFEKTVGALKEAADALDDLSDLAPRFRESARLIRRNELNLANYLDYMRLFVTKSREARPQEFKARAQIALAIKTLNPLAEAHGIATEIDIEPKLLGPYVPIAAYNGVVINLVSNAMKALVPKVSTQPRRIRITATNDTNRHTMTCSDNGIGIPDYLRTRIWDPLFTTTAGDDNPLGSGLGLGLSVVKQVINTLGGRIELLPEAMPGFVTSFRVSLPIQSDG